MTTLTNRSTQEDYYELPYKIFVDHGLGNPPAETPLAQSIQCASVFLAVNHLKFARLRICDSFLEAANATDEEKFPYRNHHGPLTDDAHDKWGYRFRDPKDGVVKRMWLEKFGPRVDFLDEAEFKYYMFVSKIRRQEPEDQERQNGTSNRPSVDLGEVGHGTSEGTAKADQTSNKPPVESDKAGHEMSEGRAGEEPGYFADSKVA
jgi:hypothetical protein